MTLNTVFEKEICGRCHGTGQFSFNQVDGSRCYGCGGKGERLTKRGAAANAYFLSLCQTPLSALSVGDVIQCEQMSVDGSHRLRYFAQIVEISEPRELSRSLNHATGEWRSNIGVVVKTAHEKHGSSGLAANSETLVRKAQSPEEKAAKIADALAYQARLTKTGEERKRP